MGYRAGSTLAAGAFIWWTFDGGRLRAEVSGTKAVPPANGQPNVCWIIRWPVGRADEQLTAS
ncbi:MAG: hypothetical protein CM15mP120_29850 [Pseudomonadota bacterium]|nr:MAG: hypothetical protein CM15mP120_29850 [Pseudomonadota bacterium]